jgi:hypothetical protein
MPQTKQASKRRRRRKALPVLGAAGLSLSLAAGSAAAANVPAAQASAQSGISQQVTLAEEEISDVSLATFHVFDKEQVGAHRQRVRLAMAAGCGGGCMGCGGCGGCWTGTNYQGSVFGNYYTAPPPYPPPHPRKPASKYAKTPKSAQAPKNQ